MLFCLFWVLSPRSCSFPGSQNSGSPSQSISHTYIQAWSSWSLFLPISLWFAPHLTPPVTLIYYPVSTLMSSSDSASTSPTTSRVLFLLHRAPPWLLLDSPPVNLHFFGSSSYTTFLFNGVTPILSLSLTCQLALSTFTHPFTWRAHAFPSPFASEALAKGHIPRVIGRLSWALAPQTTGPLYILPITYPFLVIYPPHWRHRPSDALDDYWLPADQQDTFSSLDGRLFGNPLSSSTLFFFHFVNIACLLIHITAILLDLESHFSLHYLHGPILPSAYFKFGPQHS